MTSYRADQVGEQVREEIMSIIRRDLKDPRIGFVSITAVRMSPDLRPAGLVSVLRGPAEQKASSIGLVAAEGEMGRAHDGSPVTRPPRLPRSACKKQIQPEWRTL